MLAILSSLPKSVTRTIRLDEDLDTAIQDRARDSKMAVNYLVNRAVRRLIEWDIPSEQIGMVAMPMTLVTSLFGQIDEQSCTKLGKMVSVEFFKPFAEYLFGEFSVYTSIMLFKRIAEYGRSFVFDTSSDSRKHLLVLRHGRGRKLSVYYASLIEGVFHDLLGRQVEVEYTDALCMSQLANSVS
jgi:phage-related holin